MDAQQFTDRDRERFWSKVVRTESCWLWTACRPLEYGRFNSDSGSFAAHRVSYALANGSCPDETPFYQVCHKCDIPACINPAHLFLGTAKDNARDKIAKGRVSKVRAKYKQYGGYCCEVAGRLYAVANIRQWNGKYLKKRKRINSPQDAAAVAKELIERYQDPRWLVAKRKQDEGTEIIAPK